MAYLPSFEYDIFISYAHVDNLAAAGGKGWVHRFQEQLGLQLSRRLGRIGAAKIWWDDRLDGSRIFDRTIQEAINRSALFLALTSEGYLKSDYCRKELQWFCHKARAEAPGLAVGDRARVFNILLNNIPFERWPEEYGGTSGYPFHDAEKKELGHPVNMRLKGFERQLNKLVDVIHEMLLAIENAPPEEESFTVFLADTADSLATTRKRVFNDLRQKGVKIFDKSPPPYEARQHEEAVVARIKAADLCVHLLDGVPGREIDDAPGTSYLGRQAELGLEHARSQFIWVPKSLDTGAVDDESHKGLLDRLENDPPGGSHYRFVRELPSSIVHDVLERIEQIKRERKLPPEDPSRPSLAALVDTHFKDQQHVIELSRFLLDRQVLPLINPEQDSPQQNLEVFGRQLQQASLLIIVFGGVPSDWVRERLGEALKIAATSRDCPLRACGVYLAPPRKREEDVQFNQSFLPVHLMDNTERFNPQTVTPLLDRIR